MGRQGERETDNLEDELLEGLDMYLDDINDRLMISRMVSNSLIKGMVNAIEQDTAEKIAAKELELANMIESFKFCNKGLKQTEYLCFPVSHHEPVSLSGRMCKGISECYLEHEEMTQLLDSVKVVAREQLNKLKKDIDGSSSIKRIGSGSELKGLSGILLEKESESWAHVNRKIDCLKMTMESMFAKVEGVFEFSEKSVCEWQQERDIQAHIEAIVMQSSVRSVLEEFEEKFWDQNARISQSVNWIEKVNEMSILRQELDRVLKLMSTSGTSQLSSHGSHDTDIYHRKTLSNPVTSSLWEVNGSEKLEGYTDVPEKFDAAQLNHMTKEGLVDYFNSIMAKLRRNHESKVQEMTEEYYTLKREYLKEKGPNLLHKKDKDLDAMRKKIPELISKLDDIVAGNEKFPVFVENVESIGCLKNRIDSLVFENRQLRNSLSDVKNEVMRISSLYADATNELLQHSLTKANMVKLIGDLNVATEDLRMEDSVKDEVYKCVLKELSGYIRCDALESNIKLDNVSSREDVYNATNIVKSEAENADMEALMSQGIFGELLEGIMGDVVERLKDMYGKYLAESESCLSAEKKALEKESELKAEVAENEKLTQKIIELEKSMKEQESKFETLKKEKEQFELASQELCSLREHTTLHQKLVVDLTKELDLVKSQLFEASEHSEGAKREIYDLKLKLQQMIDELKAANEQKIVSIALAEKRHNDLLLAEAKEKELRKQIEKATLDIQSLSNKFNDFEHRVVGSIRTNEVRFGDICSQLKSLIKKATQLRRTGLIYKQRLEMRCSDLQLAEAEVDLLGDQVDALLGLLEKIYVALNHYSSVLKHYPGIIQILKLVRKELSGESTKSIKCLRCEDDEGLSKRA